MRKLSLLMLLVGGAALGQTFDLEQFDQLFRPRVRMDARWTPSLALVDSAGEYEDRSANAVLTFPIHKRWSANVRLDLSGDDLKDMLKNSVRVRASQVMGNVRFGSRQVVLGEDAAPRRLYSASLGALGISLTKKYRVLFWSANLNLSEEDKSFDSAVPRGSAVLGKIHIKGAQRQFFYGLALAVSDHFVLPSPFIGGTAPLGGDWSFQYILPVQVAVGFKPQARTKFMAGIGLDGFRSGIEWNSDRANLNYAAARAFLNVRHKVSDHFQLRADVGYAFAHTARIGNNVDEPDRYPLTPGMSFGVGVNVLFGESVLERVMDEVLR